MTRPKLTTTWGAGYSFSRCHAERAVPYDPYLDGVFDGEEFSKFARLFTHGYDVYTPSRSYIGHDYNHRKVKYAREAAVNAGRWNNNGASKQRHAASKERLRTLLELPGGDLTEEGRQRVQRSPWGLGSKRSMDQLIEFTGFNLRTKEFM